MRRISCTITQVIDYLTKSQYNNIEYCLEGKVSLDNLHAIAKIEKQNYCNYSEEDLLKRNVLKNSLNLKKICFSGHNRIELIKALCLLPFKIVVISEEMANLLSVDWKEYADPVYGSLNADQITELFDPCHFAQNFFHDCDCYAYIIGLKDEAFWEWCAIPCLSNLFNKMDKSNLTETMLSEIVHWKKFWQLFEGIPELHFVYYLNHWENGVITEFFNDYPEIENLPERIEANIRQKQVAFNSKIRHINTFVLVCKKSELKYYVLDNKGSKNSVFHLKILGNISSGSIDSGYGVIYKWLCDQHFNGCFGLDLRESYGLIDLRGESFSGETPDYPLFSVRLKYLYLPNETRSLYWHSFINQPLFTELLFSDKNFSFFDDSLSDTSIKTFRFPSKFYISPKALPWKNLIEISLPNTFAIEPLFSNISVSQSDYNLWDFLITECKSLKKIVVPQGMDGFLLSIQKKYIQEFMNINPNIRIEYI